jgi:ATP-dependent Clp protease ATP-binding subunit ClpC
MSEYMEKHTVSRMIGAPPGYIGYDEGGQLTEAVRRRPYRVVLFDEIEKAHPDVFNVLLQILEDGRLTDGQGHVVDFRNTVIIMTSNVGTAQIRQFYPVDTQAGQSAVEKEQMRKTVLEEMRLYFRPEFLNRIDEIIIFEPLGREQIKQIVDLLVNELRKRLTERGIDLELTSEARDWLADEGFDSEFGARPLRRAIQRHVENPLSRELLQGGISDGDTVVIEKAEGGLVFRKKIIAAA